MLAFFLAFIMGVAFIVLLKFLLHAINKENKKLMLIFLLCLVALFVAFAATAVSNLWQISYFLSGFLSGTALTATGVYIYKNIFKRLYGIDINLEHLRKWMDRLLKLIKHKLFLKP